MEMEMNAEVAANDANDATSETVVTETSENDVEITSDVTSVSEVTPVRRGRPMTSNEEILRRYNENPESISYLLKKRLVDAGLIEKGKRGIKALPEKDKIRKYLTIFIQEGIKGLNPIQRKFLVDVGMISANGPALPVPGKRGARGYDWSLTGKGRSRAALIRTALKKAEDDAMSATEIITVPNSVVENTTEISDHAEAA